MGKQLNDVALWKQYIDNDRPIALRNKLAENNLNIIHEVINQTTARYPALLKEDRNDLFQQGYFGLNSAIERFVLKDGNYFYKFAYPFVYGRLMSWLRDKSRTIRVPVVKHDITMRYFKTRDKLHRNGENSITLRKIFEQVPDKDKQLGFKRWSEIIVAWHCTQTGSVYDTATNEDDGLSILERVESKEYVSPKDMSPPTTDIYATYPELRTIARTLSGCRCFKQDEKTRRSKQNKNSNSKSVVHFNKENLK